MTMIQVYVPGISSVRLLVSAITWLLMLCVSEAEAERNRVLHFTITDKRSVVLQSLCEKYVPLIYKYKQRKKLIRIISSNKYDIFYQIKTYMYY